jgi:hypothetical protein
MTCRYERSKVRGESLPPRAGPLVRGVVQVCQTRRPKGPFEGSCNVTACENPVDREVGGGYGGNLFHTALRLCRVHADMLARELRRRD